jgi:hypothetical protein
MSSPNRDKYWKGDKNKNWKIDKDGFIYPTKKLLKRFQYLISLMRKKP